MRWFTHSFALPVRISNFIYDQTKNDLNDLRRMKLIPKNCFNCRDWVCVFTRTQHTLMRCAYNKRREFMWITIKIRILFVNLNFMAIFCIFCHELFAIQGMQREKFIIFVLLPLFLFVLLFQACEKWQRHELCLTNLLSILCIHWARRQTFFTFFARLSESFACSNWACICIFWVVTHIEAINTAEWRQKNHNNTNCSLVKRCTHHGNHAINGTRK